MSLLIANVIATPIKIAIKTIKQHGTMPIKYFRFTKQKSSLSFESKLLFDLFKSFGESDIFFFASSFGLDSLLNKDFLRFE